MEYRARRVQSLEFILNVERLEDILGEADRQVRGIGVVGGVALLGSGDDVGIALYIVLCEAIGGRLRGGRSCRSAASLR